MRSHYFSSFSFILFLTILFNGESWCASGSAKNTNTSPPTSPRIQNVKSATTPEKTGTTIYKKDKVFPGYNIYTSDMTLNSFVRLVDMNSSLLHVWERNKKNEPGMWAYATPFPDGSIFVTYEGATTINWQRVNAASQILATYNLPGQKAHAATYGLKDGGFLGLVDNVPDNGRMRDIKNDSLVHISSSGQLLKQIPLSKLFAKDPTYQKKIKSVSQKPKKNSTKLSTNGKIRPFDPTHTVYIENLEQDIPNIAKKGCWLVTVRNLNRIIIVDPDKEEIIWQWGENIINWPHHAKFINGNQILLFDNGIDKKSSRIIIVDIKSKQIVWQYGQKPDQEFFTYTGGSVQRLPNDNTLISETNTGRAFEVTPSGEIVWEFYAQRTIKGKNLHIRSMIRVPYDFFKSLKFNYGKTFE
ncbi:MAG: hypothetical protein HQL21_05020 [Candidatus Omnitrophica bacterium]|nr:hypothetical protein [Candidatus Omnitrophota bacterium]